MARVVGVVGAACLALAVVSAGCAESDSLEAIEEQPGVVKVVAPSGKCWSGAIGDSTKDGCGSKSFDITNEAIIVANAQKQDPGKWKLRLVLEVDGAVVDEASTTATFGIAQVSE
jgi:hypothetical protein